MITITYQFTNGATHISLNTFIADTLPDRLKGLLTLPCLQVGEALLLTPCQAIHTFGMKYALDLIYLDKHDRIIKLVKNLPPGKASICWLAKSALELKAGEIDRLGLTNNIQGYRYA